MIENFFSNRRLLILAHIVVKTLYLLYYNYKTLTNRKLWRKSIMKKIMFGNSLMLLGIAIMILAGLELIYIGIMWASFLLIPVGFIMAVIGFFSKDS